MSDQPTPGPWKFSPVICPYTGAESNYSHQWLEGADGKDVISLDNRCDRDTDSLEMDIDPADARLIAAAPDLLAACETSAEVIADALTGHLVHRTTRAPLQRLLPDLYAVIAKARNTEEK